MLPPALRHIDCWIFDLDNSLYPASADLFALIDVRMGRFIQQLLGCGESRTFLDYVHDIDLARISADPRLVAALDRLPGRKFVFTNGDEAYARRVLDKLGLANAFDGLHDIHAMDYVPKPDPRAYALMCERHGIAPERALMVEDMSRNLAPAKQLGMVTVWIDNGSEQASHEADPATIDYRIGDIGEWLHEITGGSNE
jgi:putative hydrolase of the HAD superfamily